MSILLRKARLEDAQFLLDLRNDPEVRRASRNTGAITLETHTAWLGRKLHDPDALLFIVEESGTPLSQVRFDVKATNAEISIAITADFRGKGYGSPVIKEATELCFREFPNVSHIRAVTNLDNEASAKSFIKAGYTSKGEIEEEGIHRRLFVFDRSKP